MSPNAGIRSLCNVEDACDGFVVYVQIPHSEGGPGAPTIRSASKWFLGQTLDHQIRSGLVPLDQLGTFDQ